MEDWGVPTLDQGAETKKRFIMISVDEDDDIEVVNVDNMSYHEVRGILHDAMDYWACPWFWRNDGDESTEDD